MIMQPIQCLLFDEITIIRGSKVARSPFLLTKYRVDANARDFLFFTSVLKLDLKEPGAGWRPQFNFPFTNLCHSWQKNWGTKSDVLNSTWSRELTSLIRNPLRNLTWFKLCHHNTSSGSKSPRIHLGPTISFQCVTSRVNNWSASVFRTHCPLIPCWVRALFLVFPLCGCSGREGEGRELFLSFPLRIRIPSTPPSLFLCSKDRRQPLWRGNLEHRRLDVFVSRWQEAVLWRCHFARVK